MSINTKLIAEFPAFRIFEMPKFKRDRIRHGMVFAIMFPSKRYGELPHFFTFGSVFGYAVENGDNPIDTYNRAVERKDKIRWANANATVLDNSVKTQKDISALKFGDEISFEGTRYRLEKAPNDNVSLVEI